MQIHDQNASCAVATLASSTTATTCCAIVARQKRFRLIPASSFEEASTMVKRGSAEFLLVPGAYPKIRVFLMDPALRLVDAFIYEIPELVVASKKGTPPPYRAMYAHPATQPFWDNLGAPVIEVQSNDAAAAAAASHPDSGCITNSAAARAFDLVIVQVLRMKSPMSWNLFQRAA